MAPEQFEGKVCRGSDVYALGICMYEMVTGELPFSGEGGGVLLAKLNKTYVPPSRLMDGLPTGFDDVLDKVLEPDSEKRWKSAAEFAAALKRLA
jgi:serine/threonine-protein kinase